GRVLAIADAFVSASLTEGASLAVLEAMMAGIPVVAAPCEGNVEVLADGAGLIAADATPQRLAEAVTRILSDRALAQRTARIARQRVAERYDFSRTVQKLEASYAAVLRGVA